MSSSANLEERVANLERIVGDLQRRSTREPAVDWIERMKGCVTDLEVFDQATEYGRRFRNGEEPWEEEGGTT